MAKPDIESIKAAAREKAMLAKASVGDKMQEAKRSAAQKKALHKNPPPQYAVSPEYTDPDDPEKVDSDDISALEAGFKKRAKDEGRRFALATDTEYWACLCFQTREQKEAFLRALKLASLGDKYLDGQEVAKVLGVKLPNADVPYNTSEKIDRTWAGFVE